MRSFTALFARLFRRVRPIRRPIIRREPSIARLAVESLEERCVPSASPGGPFWRGTLQGTPNNPLPCDDSAAGVFDRSHTLMIPPAADGSSGRV